MPSYTFVATASAVALIGAVPYSSIQPSTYNIDPDAVEGHHASNAGDYSGAHRRSTRDLDRLTALAKKHDIRI